MQNIGKATPKQKKWKWGKSERELLNYFKKRYGNKD
jgi:cytochrome c-type biogenesis protein CcmH/NrfF